MNLANIKPQKKDGSELFHADGKPIERKVIDFWSWSSSDFVGNALRGLVAEYLVAVAVGADKDCRVEWNAYDVITPGRIKIEVKSAAYVQSWSQKHYSSIQFDIKPSMGWDAATNVYDNEAKRAADVYCFCLLAHKDQDTIDPLNVNQWRFFILPTRILDEKAGEQKKISLNPLLALGAREVPYSGLEEAIEKVNA